MLFPKLLHNVLLLLSCVCDQVQVLLTIMKEAGLDGCCCTTQYQS